jgi:hypothetical protein
VDAWLAAQDSVSPFSIASERVLCFAGNRGKVDMMVSWSDETNQFNSISGSFPSAYIGTDEAFEAFISWIAKLTACVNPAYGFIQNMMTKGWANPYNLFLRLPDIPWGTIFGAPYVEMFGEQSIISAPFAEVTRWASGHFFCKLTGDLRNSDLPMDIRQSIRSHLGSDAFMEGTRQPRQYKDGRSPFAKPR